MSEDVLITLEKNLRMHVFSFLGSRELLVLVGLSTSWAELEVEFDELWKDLCWKRWRVTERIRTIGVASWKEAYNVLKKKQKPPRGPFTPKHEKCFGKFRGSGVDAWILLGANNNCRGITTISNWGSLVYEMELRLCIQNVSNSSVCFNPHDAFVLGRTADPHVQEKLNIVKRYLVVKNAKKVQGSDEQTAPCNLLLGPLEYAIVCVVVDCPPSVQYETDLLARVHSLGITVVNTHFGKEVTLDVSVETLQELDYIEHFLSLPGGVVLRADWGSAMIR